ncbi:MAG: ArsR/SmtB family transcription factor [Fimbriimonadaceae bacterium]
MIASALQDQVFTALADPARREMISRLATQGRLTTGDLTANLEMTRQGATRHLHLLEEAGLIQSHKEGRTIYRELNPAPLRGTTEWLKQIESDWDSALTRLADQYR